MGDVIAFGDDRSPHADRAWLWLNSQPWPGWSVDVVTVQPEARVTAGDPPPAELGEWSPRNPRRAFSHAGFAAVRHLQATGDPATVLGSCREASVVVVGAGLRHGLAEMALGSTVDQLLQHPPAPLVVAYTPDSVRNVLVCTDGSASAEGAVNALARLPLATAAERIAVIGVATVGMYDDSDEVFAGVHRAVAGLRSMGAEAIEVTGDGNVAGAVLEAAEAMGAQLVVVGTRGLSGLRRVVLGSKAAAIARAAPCSVMVVPG